MTQGDPPAHQGSRDLVPGGGDPGKHVPHEGSTSASYEERKQHGQYAAAAVPGLEHVRPQRRLAQ